MQTNTGNQGEGQTKFVPRVEMAVMQYVILDKAQRGEVTRDNLQQAFRGNLKMSSDHFDHCIRQLVSEGHLKENGNKYEATEDGREDVQKLQGIIRELPNVLSTGGSQGHASKGQPATVGGAPQGSGSTTGAIGGSGGQNMGQPKGGPSGQSTTGNVSREGQRRDAR